MKKVRLDNRPEGNQPAAQTESARDKISVAEDESARDKVFNGDYIFELLQSAMDATEFRGDQPASSLQMERRFRKSAVNLVDSLGKPEISQLLDLLNQRSRLQDQIDQLATKLGLARETTDDGHLYFMRRVADVLIQYNPNLTAQQRQYVICRMAEEVMEKFEASHKVR